MGKETEDPSQMTEKEIMESLLRTERCNARHSMITMITCMVLTCVLTIAVVVVVPRLISIMNSETSLIAAASEIKDNLNTLTDNAQSTLDNVNNLANNANDVITQNSDELTEAINKISYIDIESLNQSIKDLQSIVEPLSRVSSIFGN